MPLSTLYSTAFVTGASAGLGRAFAAMLLAEGVKVWGTARDPARLAELAAHPGFTPVAFDLADAAAAEAAFARAAAEAGGAFDLVINNAGYGRLGPFAEMEFAAWQAQVDAMLVTTARLAHAALRGLRARPGPARGALVHVTSLAVEFPLPFMAGYNVAKAGLAALSESLLVETAGTGLSVIDFRPGDYQTDFNHVMQSHTVLPADEARLTRVWRTLEANLHAGPAPAQAAQDLRRALARRRRGVVRSGTFFQARLAPLLARLAPLALRRAIAARYFGAS